VTGDMPRVATPLALAIALITGLALIFSSGRVREPRPDPVTRPTVKTVDRVEVQHVLVTAEEVHPSLQSPAVPQVRSSRRVPDVSRAAAPVLRSAINRQKPSTLSGRTRRALLGDGRHKPQPFPRINN
jgi:hypothetical protein